MSQKSRNSYLIFIAGWFSVLVVLLCAFVLNRQSDFQGKCIGSGLVDSLVFFSEQQMLPNCQESPWGKYEWVDLTTNQRMRHWIHQLEDVQSFWPRPANSVQAIVLNSEPFIFLSARNYFLLGGALAQNRNQLQSAIVESWLNQTAPGVDQVERGILTDFLVAVANGVFVVPRLTGGDDFASDKVAVGYVPEREEYCFSDWRRPAQQWQCEEDSWLQPILAKGLYLLYDEAGIGERRRLREWLVENVTNGSDVLLNREGVRDVPWAKAQIARWANVVLTDDRRAQFLAKIQVELGFDRVEHPGLVLQARQLPTHLEFIKPIMVIQNQQWLWWDGSTFLATSAPGNLPRHVVTLGCHSVIERHPLEAQTSVLYADACDLNSLAGWESLAESNLGGFIRTNPTMNLLWLNARALRKLDPQSLSLKQMRILSLWQEDRWDASLQIFRPRAAIDLVLGHRASRNML